VPIRRDPTPYQPRNLAGMASYPVPHSCGVGALLGLYALGIAANFACMALFPSLVLLAYPITGMWLSRAIGRRIMWWGMRANVQNVAAVKLRFAMSWPIAMPGFIWKLFVARHL